ncbi:hypothetical protein ACS0TY_007782 [Phlomoides rotata]
MASKEESTYPISEASPGSSVSLSSPRENEVLLNETIVLNENNGDNSRNDTNLSEDEGYVSGYEEFEGEVVGDGNLDSSVKIESLPIEGVVVGNDDDDVEKGNKVIEGDENVVGKESEGGVATDDSSGDGGVEGSSRKGEVLDSPEKLGVTSEEVVVESGGEIVGSEEVKAVVQEVDIKGEESVEEERSGTLSLGDEVSDPLVEEVAESEVSEFVDADEGDAIVDSIQVDVAGPGVVVVGETEENGDTVDKPEEVVAEVAVAEPEKPEVVSVDDASLTPEGDSVVEAIQVDMVEPGVVVVGETEEGGDVKIGGAEVVAEVAVAEPEKPEVVSVDDASLTPEGDSVVDAIQVDMVEPGVVVVGETEEGGDVKIGGAEVPLESVGGVTESGDGVVEDVSSREVEVDFQNSEPAVDNSVDVVESKPVKSEHVVVDDEKNGNLDAGAVVSLVNGDQTSTINDSIDSSGTRENGIISKTPTDEEDRIVDEFVGRVRDENQLDTSDAGTVQPNDKHTDVHAEENGSEESKWATSTEPSAVHDPQEIREVEDEMDEDLHPEGSVSDEETDGMIFGSSEAAKKFIEELERESGGHSLTGVDSSHDQSRDGQIVTDSEEEEEGDGEGETDDEGDGKEIFDSAALAALLKAATGADTGAGNITITSQDGSRLFSVERPAGLGSSLQSLRPAPRSNRPSLFSSLTPAGGGETEENLSEEEKKKLEKLQQIRVKFLRLVHRLGLSPEESVAQQVLYRLALLGGRQGTQTFGLDAAKRTALQLESGDGDDLDFSITILVLGKSGVGKSATINSLFGEEKAAIDAFETGTASVKEISGLVNGVKIRVIDTPGLKSSVMEQGFNRGILTSVKRFTKKSPPDVVLYVDRLDAQSRDLNDLPMLKTVTGALGSSIWRSAIVTLTHGMSAPPDGPSGTPLSYEVFISQRSHVVQQSIGHAVGDLRMMSPSLMNPVSLVENHPSCRKNREGQKILPNGQIWRPQLLLLCYSMKILSEASSISKPQDPFDHRKLFGFRTRAPPLPYMLSSMLQSRPHPKLQSDQGGDGVDSDIDLDDFSDSDQEEEDEYDQLPPFKPLRKTQLAKLSREQKKAYFEEYDYRVKLLQKKQWKEELRRMREIKKLGKDAVTDNGFPEDDADSGAAARVAVPLPDMALPPSFDGDNPAYRYRFLEPTSQFLARPVLDTHGWDHDCGYDGVNLEHSLAIASRFPASYTVQITKDKKDFSISLDSSISAKQGENISTMAGFDIQSIGKQLAYIVRGETKIKNIKRNKATGGISFTFLGENIVPGVKIEDQITFGKQYALVGSAGAVRSQHDTAYGANFELQRRELDYPIGQVQSTFSMSIIKWRGDLALGFNSLAQFAIGRNSKVAVRAGINNKLSGQVTVRTSSSEHLSLALTAVLPVALSIYKKLYPGAGEKFSIY